MKVIEYERTCLACPSQWEGKLEDGQMFYARFRHGSFSIGVGPTVHDAIRNRLYSDTPGLEDDGFMSDIEFRQRMLKFEFDLSEAKFIEPVEPI